MLKINIGHCRGWHVNIDFLVIESVGGNINFFEHMGVYIIVKQGGDLFPSEHWGGPSPVKALVLPGAQ